MAEGGGNQLFDFRIKTFKHTNSFVEVGDSFWWTAFSHLSLHTWQSVGTVSGLHPRSSQEMASSGSGSNICSLGAAVSDFRASLCKET